MAKVTGLYVVPDHRPLVMTFDDELQNYQALVGGHIEAISLNADADIICNECAKLNEMPANRMLKYSDFDDVGASCDRGFDIIRGNFLIIGADNERGVWKSLTNEQIEQYSARFENIEIYLGHELGVIR